MMERLIASCFEIMPKGSGRYGFDIRSAVISVAWFNAFDAPFKNTNERLAGRIIKINKGKEGMR
jgi:hypothetical protein